MVVDVFVAIFIFWLIAIIVEENCLDEGGGERRWFRAVALLGDCIGTR